LNERKKRKTSRRKINLNIHRKVGKKLMVQCILTLIKINAIKRTLHNLYIEELIQLKPSEVFMAKLLSFLKERKLSCKSHTD